MVHRKFIKLSIFLLISISSFSSFSVEIKLRCEVSIKANYAGLSETTFASLIAEVDDSGKNKMITISSSDPNINYISVTTYPSSKTDKIKMVSRDESNTGKWDIHTTQNFPDKTKLEQRVYIDRSSGEIMISSLDRKESHFVTAGGSCEKIDNTKKKF